MMLSGYFDASGHVADSDALVVSGWVASVGRWKQFEKDWCALLRNPKFDLDYLHMKEFRSGKGKFAKFRDNLPLQTELFSSVYRLLELRAEATTGCVLLLKDWERVNADYRLQEVYGHPFAFAAAASVNKALRWQETKYPRGKIQFVFDHGEDGWGDFVAMCRKLWDGEIIPAPDSFKNQVGLQAADHVAWEKARFAREAIKKNFAPRSVTPRGSLDALMEKFQPDTEDGNTWYWVDEKELRRICPLPGAPGPIPRR